MANEVKMGVDLEFQEDARSLNRVKANIDRKLSEVKFGSHPRLTSSTQRMFEMMMASQGFATPTQARIAYEKGIGRRLSSTEKAITYTAASQLSTKITNTNRRTAIEEREVQLENSNNARMSIMQSDYDDSKKEFDSVIEKGSSYKELTSLLKRVDRNEQKQAKFSEEEAKHGKQTNKYFNELNKNTKELKDNIAFEREKFSKEEDSSLVGTVARAFGSAAIVNGIKNLFKAGFDKVLKGYDQSSVFGKNYDQASEEFLKVMRMDEKSAQNLTEDIALAGTRAAMFGISDPKKNLLFSAAPEIMQEFLTGNPAGFTKEVGQFIERGGDQARVLVMDAFPEYAREVIRASGTSKLYENDELYQEYEGQRRMQSMRENRYIPAVKAASTLIEGTQFAQDAIGTAGIDTVGFLTGEQNNNSAYFNTQPINQNNPYSSTVNINNYMDKVYTNSETDAERGVSGFGENMAAKAAIINRESTIAR